VTRAARVDEVVELYRDLGAEPYDEEVSQLAHALQTAALAEAAGATDALVVAALLHDVGHLLDLRQRGGALPEGDARHEQTGARFLAALFGPEVTAPIALHVQAKRYLCAVEPEYVDLLSAGSQASLARQGGPFSEAEAATFEARPGHADAVRLRRWDDRGKVDGLAVPSLSYYRALLERLAVRPPR
jgi:phosphonate degradation associated HDIG domain protein